AGDDLVEDQERALTVATLAQPVEEALLRRHAAHVASDRLDHDRRDPPARSFEHAIHVVEIVVARHAGVARHTLRHARRARHAPGRGSRPCVSRTRAPFADAIAIGGMPAAPNARTGECTPPGVTRAARAIQVWSANAVPAPGGGAGARALLIGSPRRMRVPPPPRCAQP